MTQRDRSAVDIYVLAIELKRLFHSEVLSCECLVYFHKVDVGQLQSCLFQCYLACRHGTNAHDLRGYARNSPAHNPTQRLRFRTVSRRHNNRGTAVDDTARVTCRNESVLCKGRLKPGENFQSGIWAHVIILHKFVDRSDFLTEPAGAPRGGCELLTTERILVLCLAVDAIFAPERLGRGRHRAPA